jgi:hypothetical protein
VSVELLGQFVKHLARVVESPVVPEETEQRRLGGVWVVLIAEVSWCQVCSSSRWSYSDEEKGGRTEHAMRKKKMCVGGLL